MDDVHGAHRTTGVVEHPFGVVAERIGVQRGPDLRVLAQLRDDVLKDPVGVVAVLGDSLLGNRMQLRLVKDVEGTLS